MSWHSETDYIGAFKDSNHYKHFRKWFIKEFEKRLRDERYKKYKRVDKKNYIQRRLREVE